MIQSDTSVSTLTQILPQTQRTEQTTVKKDDDTDFQGMLEEKCQTAAPQEPKSTGKSGKKNDAQQLPGQMKEDDTLLRELACGDLVAADAAVMLPNIQSMDVTTEAEPAVIVSTASELSAVNEEAPELPELEEQPQDRQTAVQTLPQQETEIQDVSETVPEVHSTVGNDTQAAGQDQQPLTDTRDEDEPTVTVTDVDPGEGQTVFRNVEANMIKVSETPHTEQTQETVDVDQQIADQLTTGLEQGETTVEIKLSPSSLGNVTVEVTAREDGTLHITLSAESTHTKALLEQHTDSLQQLVGGQSQKTVEVEVSQRQESHQNGMEYNDQNSRGGYQQQEQRQQQQHDGNFMQKLRLGMVSLNADTE